MFLNFCNPASNYIVDRKKNAAIKFAAQAIYFVDYTNSQKLICLYVYMVKYKKNIIPRS